MSIVQGFGLARRHFTISPRRLSKKFFPTGRRSLECQGIWVLVPRVFRLLPKCDQYKANWPSPCAVLHTAVLSADSNPTRSRLWAFDCSRIYKPLDLRKKMSCTAQSHLNHHGFLNDLRLTSACMLLAKNLPLRRYFAQNIMRYVTSIKTTETLYRWIYEWWSSRISNHLWYHHKNSLTS